MPKSLLTEYRLELSALLSLFFAVLMAIGIIGVYLDLDDSNHLPSLLEDLAAPFGNWVAWLAVIGPIAFIVCTWWLYDYVKKTRELARLIDTPSKAKFVRNLDEIEFLAWNLPQRFENKVLEKKREFKL